MRYFGEKSLSAWIHRILQASWYATIVGSVTLMVFLAIAAFPEIGGKASTLVCDSAKNDHEWREFVAYPWYVKALVFPYLTLITILLLKILSRSRSLFDNFRHNAIFTRDNAANLSTLSKLVIGFSLATFNFGALLMSLILLLVCEILKNGTALQEEHDLTV
ncbi:MAG: hypothetical protein RL318_2942 [Fibrobacterota bacterium]|jgi:hypothetical protein